MLGPFPMKALVLSGVGEPATAGHPYLRQTATAGREQVGSLLWLGGGPRCITGSYVGPFTSVAANCVITDSELAYCLLIEGAPVRGVRRIEASLISHDVEVTPPRQCPGHTGSCSVITAVTGRPGRFPSRQSAGPG